MTLRVETLDGDVEVIERTLVEYGLVVSGEMPIEKFTSDRGLIRDLKTKLEISNLELRLRQESYIEYKSQHEQRVDSLEEQVSQLHALVLSGIKHSTDLASILERISNTESLNKSILQSLKIITRMSSSDYSKVHEEKLQHALKTIRENEPNVYKRLIKTWEGIPASMMANMATPWVVSIMNALPK